MSQPNQSLYALAHEAFNQPVEGELSITFNQWDNGKDLVINVDEIEVLSIPIEQAKQLSNLLEVVG